MKLLYYFLSLHCTLWKKLIVCRLPARSEQLLSTSTKGAYIPKLFGIFLYMRFVSSPALIYIFNHRYQYGLDIYTLGYNPIPQFHFLLILSQHGPLAALSVGSWVPLTDSQHYVQISLICLFELPFLGQYTMFQAILNVSGPISRSINFSKDLGSIYWRMSGIRN